MADKKDIRTVIVDIALKYLPKKYSSDIYSNNCPSISSGKIKINIKYINVFAHSQLTFSCSKSLTEALDKCVKYKRS